MRMPASYSPGANVPPAKAIGPRKGRMAASSGGRHRLSRQGPPLVEELLDQIIVSVIGADRERGAPRLRLGLACQLRVDVGCDGLDKFGE